MVWWRSVYSSYRLVLVGFVSAAVTCCSGSGGSTSDAGLGGNSGTHSTTIDSGGGAQMPFVDGGGGGTQATVIDSGGDTQAAIESSVPVADARPEAAAVDSSPATDSAPAAVTGDITFTPPSGTFKGSVSVDLSTDLAAAEIRYTTDGTVPSPNSNLYTGAPISINRTTRLLAQAFVGGNAQGKVGAALYVARSIDPVHDIPVVVLDAYGSGPPSTSNRSYVDVAFLAFEPVNGSTSLDATPALASLAAYHVRGQSSAMFDKLSYRIELRDENDMDLDRELFGMPAEADWALVGPHSDKTLIHNNFVYGLGRDMGLAASRIVLAEVYLVVDNQPLGNDDYVGVYQVVEIIKNQKNRIDLRQLDPTIITHPEITGGYIFKFEWRAVEPPIIQCPEGGPTCWSDLELVDPDPFAPEQMAYIEGHLKAFNDAIHSMTPADPVSGYPAYIDGRSFVDHIIVNEFTRSMDAYARSQYFYKDREAKIFAGPLWDFDLIAGVGMDVSPFGASFPNRETSGWQYESNATRMTCDWFDILIAEPNFRTQLVQRWQELRQGLLSDASIRERIDQLTAGKQNAAQRNFQRWNILSQPMVMPFATPTEPTWAGQLEFMKNWLVQRAAWIDGQWR